MTGDAGTPLTAKWQIIELDEAQGIGSVEIEDGFTLTARYFRMHLVGYFEGIDSERGLEWRCSDSLSLREFLRLESRDRVPDHSWLDWAHR